MPSHHFLRRISHIIIKFCLKNGSSLSSTPQEICAPCTTLPNNLAARSCRRNHALSNSSCFNPIPLARARIQCCGVLQLRCSSVVRFAPAAQCSQLYNRCCTLQQCFFASLVVGSGKGLGQQSISWENFFMFHSPINESLRNVFLISGSNHDRRAVSIHRIGSRILDGMMRFLWVRHSFKDMHCCRTPI